MGRGAFLLVLIVWDNAVQQSPVREELSCVDLNEQPNVHDARRVCVFTLCVCVSINQQWGQSVTCGGNGLIWGQVSRK